MSSHRTTEYFAYNSVNLYGSWHSQIMNNDDLLTYKYR